MANSMLLEQLKRRYDTASTVFFTRYAKKDWHQRLGSGVHANAITDRIVHNTSASTPAATTCTNTPP